MVYFLFLLNNCCFFIVFEKDAIEVDLDFDIYNLFFIVVGLHSLWLWIYGNALVEIFPLLFCCAWSVLRGASQFWSFNYCSSLESVNELLDSYIFLGCNSNWAKFSSIKEIAFKSPDSLSLILDTLLIGTNYLLECISFSKLYINKSILSYSRNTFFFFEFFLLDIYLLLITIFYSYSILSSNISASSKGLFLFLNSLLFEDSRSDFFSSIWPKLLNSRDSIIFSICLKKLIKN